MLFLNWASAEGCITVIHLILCATLWPRYFVLHLWENKEVKHPGPGSQVGNGGGGGGASQAPRLRPGLTWPCVFLCFFFPFIFISWKLITLQYCSGFCHTLTWISHGFTSIPHPEPPPPPHPIPLGHPVDGKSLLWISLFSLKLVEELFVLIS